MEDLRGAGSRRARLAAIALPLLFSVNLSEASNPAYTLEHGEVEISGETSLFPYSARSVRFEGCILPRDANLYQGDIRMAMSSFVFSVPFAAGVIASEEQFDTLRHPYVNLRLQHLRPVPGRRQVKGLLEVRGERLPVEITVDVTAIESGIIVEGALNLRQSDFGVTPFEWGLLRVSDEFEILFEAFFTETTKPPFPTIGIANAALSCLP